RIYRLVHDGYKPGPTPQLLTASSQQLVDYLSHPNGWWRDNAQKLLVIHGDRSMVPALKKIATNERSFGDKLAFWKKGPPPLARLHALWTLEGLKAVDEKTLLTALKDEDAEMRKAAIRISEQFLQQQNAAVLTQLENLKADNNYGVRIQLALSLRFSKAPQALAILKELKSSNATNPLLVKAASRSMEEKDESLAELRASTVGMDGEDRDLVFQGAGNYKQLCATCHGMDGKGLTTQVAPPLAGSARVNGDKAILLNIVLHGLKGPVGNKKYGDLMVAQKEHTDEYIASVLSYIRNSFGNKQRVVSVDDVKDMRAATINRQTAWTLDELTEWKKQQVKK
ncbi:MAG: c-type cytochrome, partial [Ferruginibacter sp.]|nr:c-type cytochrome [Ferruginibacter sp.]